MIVIRIGNRKIELDGKAIKQWLRWLLHFPWYPLLLAVIPILWVYDHNKNQLAAGSLFAPILIVIILTSVVLALLNWWLKDIHKAAVLLTPLAYAAMMFQPLATRAGKLLPAGVQPGYWLLLLLVIYIGFGGYFIKRSKKFKWQSMTAPLLVFVGAMLVFNIYNIASYNWRNRSLSNLRDRLQPLEQPAAVAKNKPDIYYIITDRYTNQPVLQSQFNFGNKKFLSFLKKQGFYVANKAHSNYPNTTLSTASFLNLQYLPPTTAAEANRANRFVPYYDLIENNQLVQFVKAQGYRYNHIGSYWAPTIKSRLADTNLHYPRSLKLGWWQIEESRFSSIVVDRSILPTLADLSYRLTRKHILKTTNSSIHRDSFIKQMDFLKQVIATGSDRPEFTFMHTLMPHPPFVFDAQGRPPNKGTSDQKYVEQLKFTNLKLQAIINTIMQQSRRQAIIVIQADEGPYPVAKADEESKGFSSWPQASGYDLRRKTGILNAIYLPSPSLKFYETLSPVNTWRLILNQYFGTNLPKLPDRHFVHKNATHPYNFYDITDRIAY